MDVSFEKVTEVQVVPEEKEEIPPVKGEGPILEMEEEKHFKEETVKEQSTVKNSRFGTGIVRKIADGKIYVEFSNGMRIFPYPDAFEKGYLTL